MNTRPASLSDTLRVVRLNSRTPRFDSSFPTTLLSAVVDIPRSSAAPGTNPCEQWRQPHRDRSIRPGTLSRRSSGQARCYPMPAIQAVGTVPPSITSPFR